MEENQGFDNFLQAATLGSNVFLATQTLNSTRPSTYQVDPSGRMIVSGGGASSPLAGLTSSSWTPWLFVIIVIVFVFAFFHK